MRHAHLHSDSEGELAASERDPSELQRLLGRAESEQAAVADRLRKVSAQLLEANQSLAKIPLLEHRMEGLLEENIWLVNERKDLEAEIERLGAANAQLSDAADALRAHIDALEGSKSWRLLAPLRRLRQTFRR